MITHVSWSNSLDILNLEGVGTWKEVLQNKHNKREFIIFSKTFLPLCEIQYFQIIG